MRCDTLPLFQCLSTPLPHSGWGEVGVWGGGHLHAPYPPTQNVLLLDPFSGCSCVWIFVCVSMCAHLMAGLSHDWIHNLPPSPHIYTHTHSPFTPALPYLLAPLAPLDTVLNYLIDDSSPVTLFLLFYCYNTTPLAPPSRSPSWQLIPSVGGP